MIKKIKIEKYGPFEDAEVNFTDAVEPVFIIGVNDVGKTALLTGLASLSDSLSNKYYRNKESKIIITWSIKNNFYSESMVKSFKKCFLNKSPYSGDINVRRESVSKKDLQSLELFDENKKSGFWIFFNNILQIINKSLSMENKLNKDIPKSFTNPSLKSLIQKIKNKSYPSKKDKTAIEQIENLINFKKEIYKIIHKLKFLPATDNDEFKFIKDKYLLFEKTNEAGEIVNDDMNHLGKIIKSFINNRNYNKFLEILNSDEDEVTKNSKITDFCREINEYMDEFFSKNFPSQTKKIKFDMRTQYDYLCWTVKDEFHKNYEPLHKRSHGFLWFIKLYTFISSIKNGDIVVIDEPEKFLHASAQISLTKLFKKIKKKKKIQIIYATHSPFMLSENIFPNVKIVTKSKLGSKIYNNVNAIVNDKNNDLQDALIPISQSMGLPAFAMTTYRDIKNKIILFVEGEADIWTVKISEYYSKEELNEIFIWPRLGDKKWYSVSMAIMLKIDYLILSDGENRVLNKEFISKEKIIFLKDMIGKKNPEDMLSETTLKKYKINYKNHKVGWKELYDDLKFKKYNLDKQEIEIFIKYFKEIKKSINKQK